MKFKIGMNVASANQPSICLGEVTQIIKNGRDTILQIDGGLYYFDQKEVVKFT